MFENDLAELHTHLGASVASEILWSLAHEQGIALPVKDYSEFDRLVTIADPRRVDSLDALDQIYHWTELIQSSPLPVERYPYRDLQPLVEEARNAGLGVTIHVGEEGEEHGTAEIGEVIETLRPDRIGHGILAARDPALMRALRDAEIVLEICPTSNLLTRALPDEDAVRDTFRAFVEHGVAFTIATDGPEMMRTHLRDELELLERIGALGDDELAEANRQGHEASFVHAEAARSASPS